MKNTKNKFSDEDWGNMGTALALARRGLGNVSPNPAVGCVIVKDGGVIATGRTQPGGCPHAEAVAIASAGENAKGATAYVTLEPCSHYGKTPPCAEAIIKAGIKKCVISMIDPDERVSGRGVKMMEGAGIEVVSGCREEEASLINRGFLLHTEHGRPFVTLKIASTLDGKIAMASGESKWITAPLSRKKVQMLRASHDAVLVGSATVKADNPSFMCRVAGLENATPARFILLSVSDMDMNEEEITKFLEKDIFNKDEKSGLFSQTFAIAPVLENNENARLLEGLKIKGIEVLYCHVSKSTSRINMANAMKLIAKKRITRVLVEGGGKLSSTLIEEGFVDELNWFHAPKVIGGAGLPSVSSMNIEKLIDAECFSHISTQALDDDILSIYRKI
ncbi:MAG: bifunctional diaminohydroxyphosphoribosylaminopyrimidine deaminase/5-amino-6-(5-phosphoribosylamino)uracil reductase RibD [Alphaproteobacteria bacterium]|nr:bifunctional diaminohydroxyphosphoribosylaminopyrimidine deaminase/5-amino-6-(5-phosphoribosylamino)uracil reductase RibD [Alphaproteobacteria bacterium]